MSSAQQSSLALVVEDNNYLPRTPAEGRKHEGLDGTPTTSDDGWPQGSCSGLMECFSAPTIHRRARSYSGRHSSTGAGAARSEFKAAWHVDLKTGQTARQAF